MVELWWATTISNLQSLGIWSYLLLAVLVAFEGPVATLLGAFAASQGLMKPGYVFLAASAGNLTADMMWYSVGYAGNIAWFSRYGKWVGISPQYVSWLQAQMHRHAVKILFVAKLTLSLSLPALIAAGLSRVNWRQWFGGIFVAECIWTGGLVLAGYFFSRFLQQLESGVQIVAGLAMIVGLILFIGYIKKHAPQPDVPNIPVAELKR